MPVCMTCVVNADQVACAEAVMQVNACLRYRLGVYTVSRKTCLVCGHSYSQPHLHSRLCRSEFPLRCNVPCHNPLFHSPSLSRTRIHRALHSAIKQQTCRFFLTLFHALQCQCGCVFISTTDSRNLFYNSSFKRQPCLLTGIRPVKLERIDSNHYF